MVKQRWRKTKDTKGWLCDICQDLTVVEKDYKPEVCCSGYECGCYGMPNNPVVGKKCIKQHTFKSKLNLRKNSKRGLHKRKRNPLETGYWK
ncbi:MULTISPECIES: hypothetical protein [Bacillus cereus group]|uniref:hypothetical protein n=1 Tax=Bacillus cereus group TaxID=86661 RepID=UPI000BEE072F|nr:MULTISPECIES: hypothetical protein [Bacillus cereus group]PEF48885.1 hypothetical protein CON56_30105 [Bacillus thuringiensis]PFO88326.1 hypothetical protein COJ97_29895 [Bacillus cereus]